MLNVTYSNLGQYLHFFGFTSVELGGYWKISSMLIYLFLYATFKNLRTPSRFSKSSQCEIFQYYRPFIL